MVGGDTPSVKVRITVPNHVTQEDTAVKPAGLSVSLFGGIEDFFINIGFLGIVSIIHLASEYIGSSTSSNSSDARKPETPVDRYLKQVMVPEQPDYEQRLRWLYDGEHIRQRLAQYQAREALGGQEAASDPLNQRQPLNVDMQEIEARFEQRQANGVEVHQIIDVEGISEPMHPEARPARGQVDADLEIFEYIFQERARVARERARRRENATPQEPGQLLELDWDAEEPERLFQRSYDRLKADYFEMKSTYVLKDGDVLPGRAFDVSDPDSFYRELLTINFKEDSRAYEVLVEARRIGHERHMQGRPMVEIANEIADMVQSRFAKGQGHSIVENGKNQTVGLFYQQGGCCRHRSALLQMAYQEAGVPSRYIQGTLLDRGPHAWVEVDAKGNGTYSYGVDLNANARGEVFVFSERSNEVLYKIGGNGYQRGDSQNLNTVWRPRNPPEQVSSSYSQLEAPDPRVESAQQYLDPARSANRYSVTFTFADGGLVGFGEVSLDATGRVIRLHTDIDISNLYSFFDQAELDRSVEPLRRAGVDVSACAAGVRGDGYENPGHLFIDKESLNRALSEGRLMMQINSEGVMSMQTAAEMHAVNTSAQEPADILSDADRTEMRETAQKLGLGTALTSGAEAKALRDEASPKVATRNAAMDAARDMDRDRDRDGVSGPREAMERMKAEARDKSGKKK